MNEENKVIFSVESEWPDCPDFEITYFTGINKYGMSLETIYEFGDCDGASDYLEHILDVFTCWMVGNCYEVTKRPTLYQVFTEGVNATSMFDTIEDLYGAFSFLVCGAKAIHIQGEHYDPAPADKCDHSKLFFDEVRSTE